MKEGKGEQDTHLKSSEKKISYLYILVEYKFCVVLVKEGKRNWDTHLLQRGHTLSKSGVTEKKISNLR